MVKLNYEEFFRKIVTFHANNQPSPSMQTTILRFVVGLLWLGVVLFVVIQVPKFKAIYEDFGVRPSILEVIVLNYASVIALVAAILSWAAMQLSRQILPALIVPIVLLGGMTAVVMVGMSRLTAALS